MCQLSIYSLSKLALFLRRSSCLFSASVLEDRGGDGDFRSLLTTAASDAVWSFDLWSLLPSFSSEIAGTAASSLGLDSLEASLSFLCFFLCLSTRELDTPLSFSPPRPTAEYASSAGMAILTSRLDL